MIECCCLLLGSCDANEFACFNSTDCIPLSGRCDGIQDCHDGEDEKFCCPDSLFGCYVDASDLYDAYGGNANLYQYQCLDEMAKCDDTIDCVDGSDENPIDCELNTSTGNIKSIRL